MDQLVPSTRLRLDNQVAVVTGGARGIGAGIVRRFVEEGAQVVFSDLLDKKGKALEEELGKNVAFYQADATSASEALNSQTGTAWTGLSEEARLQALKRVEQTPFFQRLRSDFLLYFYSNPAIWPLFGYEGPSNDQGGYLNRGFNDIEWIKRENL